MPRTLAKKVMLPRPGAFWLTETEDRRQTGTMRAMWKVALIVLTATAAWAADWPDFRGPSRDGASPESVAEFPAGGPERLWERQVGAGFANPVVANGRVLLFHRQGAKEVVEALEATTGKTIWKSEYATTYRDSFGFDPGPRASPVVAGGQVYTFGAEGTLGCRRFADGAVLWQTDTHKEFGVKQNWFGAGATPLVEGSRLLLNVGGSDGAGIVAFDRDTGKVLWKSTDQGASYASAVMADIAGARRAVFFTREGLVVLSPSDGQVVFQRRWRARSNASVNAATPIIANNQIFLSSSYGVGALALDFSDGLEPREMWSGEDSLTNHYASAVLAEGVLYGYHGRQEQGQSLRAIEMKTGKVLWEERGFGAGSVTLAGGRLLLLREDGELVLAEATGERFKVISRSQVFSGLTRAYPALSNGVLYARDESTLAAFKVGK